MEDGIRQSMNHHVGVGEKYAWGLGADADGGSELLV